MGVDDPKEAVDIRTAKKHGSHQGRINTQKTGHCFEETGRKQGKIEKRRKF